MRIERQPAGVRFNLDTEKEVGAFAAALFERWIYSEFTDKKTSNNMVEAVVSLEQRIQDGKIKLPQIINIGNDLVGRTYRVVRHYANNTDGDIGWLAATSKQSETVRDRMELGDTALDMTKVMLEELGPIIFPVVPVQER